MVKYFAGVQKEIKRVQWPSPTELRKMSITVLFVTLAFGAFFVLADMGISAFLKTILGIGN